MLVVLLRAGEHAPTCAIAVSVEGLRVDWNIMHLRPDVMLTQSIHECSAGDPHALEVELEHVKMEIAAANLSLLRSEDVFFLRKGAVVLIHDLAAALHKPLEFF